MESVDRREFVKKFMDECGLTYDVASNVYKCMVNTFEDGIIENKKVTIGRLGALKPVWTGPRTVVMNINKTKKIYNLDGRYRYKFVIYKKWISDHFLKWYN